MINTVHVAEGDLRMDDMIVPTARRTRMPDCKFCEAMNTHRQCEQIARSWATDAELKEFGKWMTEYSVAIVKRSWYQKRGKKSAGRSTDYRYRGLGYKLNYCPECGRKLKRGQRD